MKIVSEMTYNVWSGTLNLLLLTFSSCSATQGQLSFLSVWSGKWVLASAEMTKAGMVYSVSWWTWGVQVKLWDPLSMRAIPEHLRGVFTTRYYTNPCLFYLTVVSGAVRPESHLGLHSQLDTKTTWKSTKSPPHESTWSFRDLSRRLATWPWS